MGLLSVLFGRSKLKKPNRERFFHAVAAEVALNNRIELAPTQKAGIVFNPVESSFFDDLNSEIRELLRISGRETGTHFEIKDDSYGTRWVVLDDPDFEDLVTTIHLVAETIFDHGFGDRLLAAVLGLKYEGVSAYWIYNYKRGGFHPFVVPELNQRDNRAEMRLGVLMEEEKLPVERSLENLYALWGIPF